MKLTKSRRHLPLLAVLLLCATAGAAEKKTAAPQQPSESAPAPGSDGDKVVWDAWYTVMIGKKVHQQYYHDHVELKKGRVFFQNQVWKKEEGFINEESLGEFAENTPDLSPLFFNFRSTYRTTETVIDGTVNDAKMLTVKIRKGDKDLPLVRRSLSDKTIFSSMFPVWLRTRLPEMKEGKALPFQTLLEDNLEAAYETVSGQVTLEKPDAYAKDSLARKLLVQYRGSKSFWWVDDKGIAARIELPQQDAVVEKSTKEKAEKFLN